MQLIPFLTFVFILSAFNSKAQEDLLNTRQKFFSLKKAKLSVGLGVESGGGSLIKFNGSLPEEYKIVHDTISGPGYVSATLYFDINAPNSILSFTSGLEWNRLTFSIENKSSLRKIDFTMSHLQIPLLLKIKMGKKFSKGNVLIFLGGSYNVPIAYSSQGNSTPSSTDIKIVRNTYSWISAIVGQINIRGKESAKGTSVPPRIWVYIKCTGLMTNEFNIDLSGNEEMEYRDRRFTFGIAYLFGGKKKHQIK